MGGKYVLEEKGFWSFDANVGARFSGGGEAEMLRSLERFRRAMRLQRGPRTVEERFHDFLNHAFGLRLSDYERMDKDLQAALNDKFAYVFLRNPLEERIRQYMLAPMRSKFCHAPGCEWRECDLTGFSAKGRHCVRCDRCQVRMTQGTGVWQDISLSDYEFLLRRDEAHRAQWEPVREVAVSTGTFERAINSPLLSANGTNGELSPEENSFHSALRR